MQGTQYKESVEIQNVGKGLICSLRRNPGLTLRKTENLSYGRLMIFCRETIHDSFMLLRQTMDAMKLYQRRHLIYNVDEEKGETVTTVVCVSASGSNWILPVVLCKGKYRRIRV
jgi:hypothetical protein